jgi:hypothetical protein
MAIESALKAWRKPKIMEKLISENNEWRKASTLGNINGNNNQHHEISEKQMIAA